VPDLSFCSPKSKPEYLTNAVFDRIARELGRIGWCPPQLVWDCTMHRVMFDLDRMFRRFGDCHYNDGVADAEYQFRRNGE
jgi:hypothetical protein